MEALYGYGFAFGAAVIWALAPVLYKRGVDRLSFTAVGAFRCVGYIISAAIYLYCTMGIEGFAVTLPLALIFQAMLSGIIWLVAGDLFYFACLHRLGVSIAVPMTSAYPLLAIPAAWFFLGESMTLSLLGAGVLIVTGIILISPREKAVSADQRPLGTGILLALLTMSCWTIGLLTNKMLTQYIPVPQLEWWRALGVTFGSFLLYGLFPGTPTLKSLFATSRAPWRVLGEVALAGTLGLTLGNLFFTYSVTYIPVNIATCVASVRPLVAALFAMLLLKEVLSRRLIQGTILVMAGVILLSIK